MKELSADSTAEEPNTAARNRWGIAVQRALAEGLPLSLAHRGRHLRVYPDGRVEDMGPTSGETSTQMAARLEMARPDASKFELADLKVPPAFHEIAETIAALANQSLEVASTAAERVTLTEGSAWSTADAVAPDAFGEPIDQAVGNDVGGAETPAAQATVPDDMAIAASGAAEYNLKMMAAACANARTILEFTSQLMQAKTFADMVELSTAYARRQIEASTDQARTLAATAEKVQRKTGTA